MALHRECCFPSCTKLYKIMVINHHDFVTSQFQGGDRLNRPSPRSAPAYGFLFFQWWRTSQVVVVFGGSCPAWKLSGWQLFQVAIVQVAVVLRGNCPRWQFFQLAVVLGGDCPRGQLPRWQLSWVVIVLSGRCRRGGSCPCGSCPEWQLSYGAVVLGGSCPGGNCQGSYSPRTVFSN